MWFFLRVALSSLATHRLRTALAMLGVFLGALALSGVQHASKAMIAQARAEVEELGPNLFLARAGQIRFRRSGSVRFGETARTFTLADARALMEQIPSVVNGAPYAATTMPIRAKDQVMAQLVATWPEYTSVRSFAPQYGRFFTRAEEKGLAKVVVLGSSIASRLFADPGRAVGKRVRIFRASFRVVGVMEQKGRDLSGTDQDEQVFMPLSTYMRRAANQDWISGVYLNLEEGADRERVRRAAEAILRSRHRIQPGEEEDFSLMAARETMRLQRQALDLVWTLGLISSSVSFAVGGLGVLSIMVLLVRQRRVEIGVRRAVGARRRDIVRQFVLEAALMSGAGGTLGLIASQLLLIPLYTLGGMPFVFDPLLSAGALAGSACIGALAGAYPAWQAAQVEILDVLRPGT
jgi:putative ABC transport system permease protein